MTILIVGPAKLHDYDLAGISVDLERQTGVLMRQSRRGAEKDHYESRLRQEALVPVAIAMRGDSDDSNVIVYDEGSGVSGTKGYDQRPLLSKLYIDIANGVIGSIVVARADRLFRDKHFRNVSMFTQIAEAKKILLIVPGRTVYDFTKIKDLHAFQKDMQDAYAYLTTEVAYLNETRAQKVQRGLYGGGGLPAPYVIDRHSSKDERIPVIFRPWLQPTLTLFRKFHEYDLSLVRIANFIDSEFYLFPQPNLEDTHRYIFATRMRVVPGGYTISSPDSLRKYLSNLTLGGFAKMGRDKEGNELVLPHAFEAAVPIELLEPAYASIKGYYLDGSPFEKGRSPNRQTRRKYTPYVRAALHGLLTSTGGAVSLRTNKAFGIPVYVCHAGLQKKGWDLKNRIGLMKQKGMWSVSCGQLDRIVLSRLHDLVRQDSDMIERIKTFWESRRTVEVNEADVLRQQIKEAEAQIARLDKLLTDPARPLSTATEERYLTTMAEVEEDLARLKRQQAAQQGQEDPQRVIPNLYYFLSHLPAEYKKLMPEGQKYLMRFVIKEVRLDTVSQHVFRLCITWENSIARCPDVALVWRGATRNTGGKWSEEEDELIRILYPSVPQLDIMKALPRRAWNRILDRAQDLMVRRKLDTSVNHHGPHAANVYHRTMSYNDLEAVALFVHTEEEKNRAQKMLNELAKETLRGNLTAHWWLPLDCVGIASIDAV